MNTSQILAPAIAAAGFVSGNYASDMLTNRLTGGVATQSQQLIGSAALFAAGLAVNHMTGNSYGRAAGMGLSIAGLVDAYRVLKGGL